MLIANFMLRKRIC